MIKLLDVLNIQPKDYKKYKVHFASGKPEPREAYNALLQESFESYQNYQTKNNFTRRYVLALASCSKNKWAFAGVYEKTTNPEKVSEKHWQYSLELLPIQTDLIGLLYVYYEKKFRQSYASLELHPKSGEPIAEMNIVELRQTPFKVLDFRSYSETRISYSELKTIVDDNVPSWRDALSRVTAIYVITDLKTGKQYVGKADGSENLWQRWSAYAFDGHGGNKELRRILQTEGENYKDNFQYSILEICDFRTITDERERYWKSVLQSKVPFGYNAN